MGAEIDRVDIKLEAEASDANKQLEETVSRLKEILAPLNDIMNHKAFVQLKQQSKEINKSLTRFSNETKAAMQDMSASMEQVSKPMENIRKSASESAKQLSRLSEFKLIPVKDVNASLSKLDLARQRMLLLEKTGAETSEAYKEMAEEVKKLESAVENPITVSTDDTFQRIKEEAAVSMQSIKESFEQVKAPIKEIDMTLANFAANAEQTFKESKADVDSYIGLVDSLKITFSGMGNALSRAFEVDQSDAETYVGLVDSLKIAFSGMGSIFSGTLTESEANVSKFSGMMEQLEEISSNIAKKFAEMKGTIENALVQSGLKTYTSQYTELQNEITKTEKTLATLNAQLARSRETVKNFETTTAYRKMQYDIAGAKKELQRLREEQDKLELSGGATQWNFKGLSEGLRNFKKALQPLGTALKNLDKKISTFVKKLRSIIFPAKGAKKSVDGFHKSLSGGLGTILKYSLGAGSLLTLFNLIKSAAAEGFQNLVLYSDKVNASISLLMNSANQLKNSFAAMVAPILNAVAPALNYLMQLCVKATNAVNQLISALLGNGTWIRAKKLTQDYRDTIQGVKDDVQEVTKTILGFDQLNVLNGKNEKADSGTGNLLPEDMFETLPVESRFKDLADKIKGILSQFFAPLKEAWNREGKFVMDSWKYALDEIWALIKSIGSDFLEVWQQEKTIKIFEDILHIIGDIGLVVGNLAHNFREAWEENETGKRILEGIRDIIGVIVANIRHAADATVEWSANLDFSPLLTKIQAWVESLVPVFDNLSGIVTDFCEKVLLPLGKWTIEEGLPDLVQVFIDFNEKVDWEALRARLSEFWEHLEPFAETVGEGLILFIERVSGALADFINSEAFDNFLVSIENWMDNVSPEDVADGIQALVTAFIALKAAVAGLSAMSGLSNLVTTFTQLSPLTRTIKDAFSGLSTLIGGISAPVLLLVAALTALVAGLGYVFATNEEVRQSFDNAVNSIKEGLQPAIEFISGTVLPNLQAGWERLVEILTPLGEFLEDAFTSIWQDMINPALTYIGETVLPKLAEAFENLWNNVLVPLGSFLADVLEPIIQIISDALSILWENVVVPLADAIGNVLAKAFESLCDIFNETLIPIVNAAIQVFQFLWDNVLAPIVDFLWDVLKPIFEKVFEALKKQIDALSETLGGLIDFIAGVFSGNWEKAWNGIKDIFSGIVDGIIAMFPGIPEAFSNAFNEAKEKVLGIIEELYNKIVGWVGKMIEKIEKVIEKAKEAIGLGSSSSSSSSSVGKGTTSSSGKFSVNIPKITIPTIKVPTISVNIPKYATGGFPEDGLFMANHGELLGKFANGKTAVANNEQITTGIENAVYRAMMSVMQSGAFGNNGSIMVNAVLKTENDEVLARAVTRGQEKIDRRYKPSIP